MTIQTQATGRQATAATDWFTPAAVARMFNLPADTVRAWLKEGRFPARRAGDGGQRIHFRCNLDHIEQIRRILAEGDPPPVAPEPAPVDPMQRAKEATRRRLASHPGPRKR